MNEQAAAWEAMDPDLNQSATLTKDSGVADIWRKAGLTVRALYPPCGEAHSGKAKPADDRYAGCNICGFVVDLSFAANKPSIDFTMAGRAKKDGTQSRLHKIAAIIEAVDNRCAACDGPVTPTLQEMTQAEISEIYALAKGRTSSGQKKSD